MRKLLLLPLLAMLPLVGMAQKSLTLNVEEAGTLSTLIPEEDRLFVKELTLTGTINSTDIGLIRTMAGNGVDGYKTDGILAKLDLSGVKIVKGGTDYYTNPSDGETSGILRDNTIGYEMFYTCFALEEVVLPEGITEIKDDAFSGCYNLVKVNIPTTVTKIGDAAFYHCSSIQEIEIPEGVTTLEDFTFSGCSSLTTVTLPSTLTKVERCVFYQNDALEEIEFPEGVTSIRLNTFGHCPKLRSVVLPSTLTSLADGVFLNCKALEALTLSSVTPPTCTANTFELVDLSKVTLYVSGAGKADYAAHAVWGQAGKIEAMDEEILAVEDLTAQPAQVTAVYTLSGTATGRNKGISLVRMSDGTVKKVMIK